MRMVRAAVLLAFLSVAGCGGDDSNGPDGGATAAARTAEGWTLFESGQYGSASGKFQEALNALSTFADAHNGLGWSRAYLDDLTGSNTSFQSALANGHPDAAPRAGWAFVLAEKTPSDLGGAITRSGEALSADGRFVFEHDTTVTWWDLRLLRAQAYFTLSQYEDAAAEVESLGGDVPRDTLSGFIITDSLLLEIERLGD